MPDPSSLTHPALRRGLEASNGETVASGYPALDACLAGGGWPRGRLTEIVAERAGCGELSLLMPALAALSREARWRGRSKRTLPSSDGCNWPSGEAAPVVFCSQPQGANRRQPACG